MPAAVAASKTNQAAAAHAASHSSDNAIIMSPAKLVDLQLLMAARRGDSKRLKELLQVDMAELKVESEASSEAVILLEISPPAPATPPRPPLDDDGVTSEGDTLLHVLAECGDSQEFTLCAAMIVQHKMKKDDGGAAAVRLALEARNSKGDTPLHRAAGAGNANMIGCLVDLVSNTADGDEAAAAAKLAFLRMQNECGETALHQAVLAARDKKACIDQLMAVDPELVCIPHEDGASPLYLAISLGEIEIARHLYVKSQGKLSYCGPDGRNVLHAAVQRGQALPMILKWLKDMTKPKEDTSSVPLVSRLTSQRDKKQKGSTPLHLAASLNVSYEWPFFRVRSGSFSQAWQLLDANESTAYQADDEGAYPIHVAAWCNSIRVVRLLLEKCPDCATLRDGKGRTFLHVATEEGRCHDVVRYVCGEMPQKFSWMILNAQDRNGDTALHGAVRAGNLTVFNCLLRNRQVRLDVANKAGMTPLDVSWTTTAPSFQYVHWNFGKNPEIQTQPPGALLRNPRNVVRRSLVSSGAPGGGGLTELFREQHITEVEEDKESQKRTDATQVLSIVAVLIATVTFASAFTLPGGYQSGGGAAGTAVLAGSYVFDAFILADTLAFICSTLATFSLVYAGAPAMDISIRSYYLNISVFLLQSAGGSFIAAFALGLYLVLAPVDHTIAIAICVIISASLLWVWGNMEGWRVICEANTVRARIGIRRLLVRAYVADISFSVLVHYGSYMIILGLPAIRKWASKS